MKEKAEQIKKIAEKYGVNTLYLFGSQASGKTHKNSDYDFAVQLNDNIKEDDYFETKLEIGQALGRVYQAPQVDLIILNNKKVPLALRYRAIKEGKVIYVHDDIRRSRLEHKLMSSYLDRKYYSDRYIKASLKSFANQTNI